MNTQIIIVFVLNFIISLIGTLAYAVRLVGVRTGKVAISFALFNILMLVSRVAVTFQVPILTKYVERNSSSSSLLSIFNIIIIISGVATIFGAFLIPTFQRILTKGVMVFSTERSLSRLILYGLTKSGVVYIRDSIAMPVKENLSNIKLKNLPKKMLIYNTLTVALITVGALAPIYAGSIEPDLRATCITLSSIINGFATIIMTVLVDPQLSIMTDDVVEGKCTAEKFRACVVGMVGSKTVGTFLSIVLLLPASYIIVFIAKIL